MTKFNESIDPVLIKKHFDYSVTTRELTWKLKHCSKVVIGNRAGTQCKRDKNRCIKFMHQVLKEHRVIWCWFYGKWPKGHIDHINHNELDNRISNLRCVEQKENNKNNSLRSDNTTGEIGIYLKVGKRNTTFQVDIRCGKERFCKAFKQLSSAIIARNAFYKKHNFHPNHGINKPSL